MEKRNTATNNKVIAGSTENHGRGTGSRLTVSKEQTEKIRWGKAGKEDAQGTLSKKMSVARQTGFGAPRWEGGKKVK